MPQRWENARADMDSREQISYMRSNTKSAPTGKVIRALFKE